MINIYVDGACKGNPGLGGWGVYIEKGKETHAIKGVKPDTTNNEMELVALVEGIKYAVEKYPDEHLNVFTDSRYIFDGVAMAARRRKAGWKLPNGRRVAHFRLWDDFIVSINGKPITWNQVKAHSNSKGNNLADKLANDAIESLKDQEI